jgi:tetratricopeptide (TPR) repeat protein
MKRIFPRILALSLLLAVPAVVSLHAGLPEEFASANANLASGHADEALSTYKTLLTYPDFKTSGSAEIWYNRGLAEMQTGDTVAASLSFRRALLLDPALAPARVELSKTLGLLGIPVPTGWRERTMQSIHPETMIVTGAVIGWIGALLLVVLLFQASRRKGLILLSLLLILFGHGASVLGTLVDPRRTARNSAVITAKTAPTLRATPADSATESGKLDPGTLISILSRNGAWWYVSTGSGPGALQGWIPSNAAAPLLSYSKDSKGSS